MKQIAAEMTATTTAKPPSTPPRMGPRLSRNLLSLKGWSVEGVEEGEEAVGAVEGRVLVVGTGSGSSKLQDVE